ncbi:hybrid sensor histidine kinase/response regulator [Alsobacter metallidurans]|nr:hybrid sensor histidine kinase/response regulator [Alsobacter metallidurans]
MGSLIAAHDWGRTPLGPISGWPAVLKLSVSTMLRSAVPMTLLWGETGVLIYNSGYAKVCGKRHPAALGQSAFDVWPDYRDFNRSVVERSLAGEALAFDEQELSLNRNGEPEQVWMDLRYSPIADEDGRFCGALAIVLDVTERVLGQRRLQESETRFREMADHAPVMVWVTNPTGHCEYLNLNWYAFTGQSLGEAAGFGWLDPIHPEDRGAAEAAFLAANAAKAPFRIEYRLRRHDGAYRLVIDAAAPRFDPAGTFLGYVGSVIDIEERRESEERLRESEARFQAIANSVDQMIWSTRPDGYHDYFNDRWYSFTGLPRGATDGERWNGVFHPDDQERAARTWRRSLATGDPYHIEYRLRHASGEYRWVLGRAQPVRDQTGAITRWFGTCTDIQDIVDAREVLAKSRAQLEREVEARTEKLMVAERTLRQMQKMDAIGQLAGGIAHDFNNMLAVVLSGLQLVQKRLARGDTNVGAFVEGAMDGAKRASALTQRLLAFARQQPLEPERLDLGHELADLQELLTRTLGSRYQIEIRTEPVWPTLADRSQFENAVLNLAVNARDAMPEGGRIQLRARNAPAGSAPAEGGGAAERDYVLVEVEDRGAGMDEATLARAFEPFFTTKPEGKGTGLGLSQIFGYVRQSGGFVRARSEPGVGTVVSMYFPRDEAVASPPSAAPDRA